MLPPHRGLCLQSLILRHCAAALLSQCLYSTGYAFQRRDWKLLYVPLQKQMFLQDKQAQWASSTTGSACLNVLNEH